MVSAGYTDVFTKFAADSNNIHPSRVRTVRKRSTFSDERYWMNTCTSALRLRNDRYNDTGATQPLHGGDQGQGYQAGNAGEAVLVLQRPALPRQQPQVARFARHCAEEIQDSRIHRRLFLAWSRRVQTFPSAEDERRFLATQDSDELRPRLRREYRPETRGMESDPDLGV